MTRNPLLAAFASVPALVAPEMQTAFEAALNQANVSEVGQRLMAETASSGDNFWFAADDWRSAYRPYNVVDGILQIPVKGVLLHDYPWAFGNWATGYEYIWRAFERGMHDAGVNGIALIINSPGGMVAGCFEATDKMVALKGEVGKPVQAFAHESAYSAAYAIATVGDKLTVSRTGGVGSIGVVTSHVDMSKLMDDIGYKITFIHAGKHKVDGNPYQALPDDVKARIQVRIDELYSIFVSTVATNRGLDEQAVRDTEALTFTASQSLSNGLADAVGTLDDALAAFAADLSEPQGDSEMSNQDTSAVDAAVAKAVADANAAAATAQEKAVADAITGERARISAILGSDEAKGRGDLASHLALETGTAADAAVALMAKSPKEADASTTTPFNAAMTNGNPEVGATVDGNENANGDGTDPVALARQAGIAGIRPAAK